MQYVEKPVKVEKVDQLSVQVFDRRTMMGIAAAKDVAIKMKQLLLEKDSIRMVFAAAPSQNEFLQALVSERAIDWSRVSVFHMDEYIGLPEGSQQKFSQYLVDHLFSHVNPGNVYLIDSANEPKDECRRYGELICSEPIDIICLGIGENGHIAFNDPPVANFQDPDNMKIVELDEVCRRQQVNDGCFEHISKVPTHALTLTIPIMMSGTYLFCIVPGEKKQSAVKQTLKGPITTECPSSILRNHNNCVMYVDRDSYWRDRDV